MTTTSPLPQDKKLTVIFRVEPGCLGPTGEELVDAFCEFAQKKIMPLDADFIHWQIVPRKDKSEAELQYRINDKILSHEQASKYLTLFDKSLDVFEEHLNDNLAMYIDEYLDH